MRTKKYRPAAGGTLKRKGFILLEIIVAMVILGIALATILRAYTNGLKALSKDKINTTAVLLAQSLLEEFEIEPPENDMAEGDFGPDYPEFLYTAKFETVKLRYRNLNVKLQRRELIDLRKVEIRITRRVPTTGREEELLTATTYLTGIEKFSPETKMNNALF